MMEGGKERRGKRGCMHKNHTPNQCNGEERWIRVSGTYMYQYRGRGGGETQGAYSLERGRVHINYLGIMTNGELLQTSFCEGTEHPSLPLDCT